MVAGMRILLSKLFSSHHLVILDEALPASLWQRSIMIAEKRLLQDIENDDVGGSETDEAKVWKMLSEFSVIFVTMMSFIMSL